MSTVYSTPYPATVANGNPSVDSGFRSVDDVVAALGDGYTRKQSNLVIYPGVVFSYLLLRIDTKVNNPYIERHE